MGVDEVSVMLLKSRCKACRERSGVVCEGIRPQCRAIAKRDAMAIVEQEGKDPATLQKTEV